MNWMEYYFRLFPVLKFCNLVVFSVLGPSLGTSPLLNYLLYKYKVCIKFAKPKLVFK